jgi:hypothetical protein
MSRYKYLGKEDYWEIVVGWDNALGTYFAQIWDLRTVEEGDFPSPVLWAGCNLGEIPTLADLEVMVERYGSIPGETRKDLEDDFARRTPPTPFQVAMAKLL